MARAAPRATTKRGEVHTPGKRFLLFRVNPWFCMEYRWAKPARTQRKKQSPNQNEGNNKAKTNKKSAEKLRTVHLF